MRNLVLIDLCPPEVHVAEDGREDDCLSQIGRGVCGRAKWVPFVLFGFFCSSFIVFFASKLAIFPLKRSVLGA